MNDSHYEPIEELCLILGYKDPVPNAGKWNKSAMKKRSEAKKRLELWRYRVGKRSEPFEDGYIQADVYEYNGVKYS